MKKIIYFLIIILLLTAIGLGVYFYIDKKKEQEEDAVAISFKDNLTFEFDSRVKVSEIISSIQGKLEDDVYVDTTKLGTNTFQFNYKSIRNKNKTKSVDITIVDTTKPMIYMNDTVTVKQGYTGNVTDLIFSGDNCDSTPERKIIGEYDLNTVGDYKLNFSIKDKSGNESSQDFTLKVVKSTTGNTQTASKITFSDAISRYKNDNTSIGIDVSQWQGNIDWKKVKEAGAEFAIIRVGYQKDYDADHVLDPYFLENIKGAQEEGLDVGIYFYSYAKKKEEAEKQANWVADNLKGYNIKLPVAFDWESWNSFVKCNMSFYDINKVAETFVKTIEDRGFTGSLYGSRNYLQRVWYTDRFENVWLAHYTKETDYDNKYYLWQFCNTGRIDGINGDVDIDVLYKN